MPGLILPTKLLNQAASASFREQSAPYTTVAPPEPAPTPVRRLAAPQPTPQPIAPPELAPIPQSQLEPAPEPASVLQSLESLTAGWQEGLKAARGAVQQAGQQASSFGEQVLGAVDDWIPQAWRPTPPPDQNGLLSPPAAVSGPSGIPGQTVSRPGGGITSDAGLGAPTVARPGAPPAGGEIESYIRASAARRGIDPDIAVRVAESEGGLTDPVRQSDVVNARGEREPSFGPFQMYMGGGLGNAALQRGIDPRNPAQWRETIDFALDNAASSGWGQWHGAARVGIGNRQGIGTYQGPVPAARAPTTARQPALTSGPTPAAPAGAPPTTLQGITPPQFGLGDADADAICGPVLAMAFAKANGRNPTIAEAKQMSTQHGGWTSAQGMGGPDAMANTLRQMGIPAHYAPGALDTETIRRETQNGNPVGINTRGHYFVVEGVDDQGRLDLGNSAKALRASGGRQWFRPDEIASLGMGAPTGAIYKDSPSSPTPSVAVQAAQMPTVSRSDQPAQAPRAASFEARQEQRAQEGPLVASTAPGVGYAAPEASVPSGPPVRDDYRTEAPVPFDPDAGPREATPGSVGAQPYLGPMAPAENPGVSETAALPAPVEQPAPAPRPQYVGPSYSQPTREQAGLPPVDPWQPIQQIGATLGEASDAALAAADRVLTGPKTRLPTWEDPTAPIRDVGSAIASNPLSVLPAAIYGEIQGAGADVIGRRAGAAAGLSDVKEPYETPLGTFELSQQDLAGLAAQVGLDPLNFLGVPATAKARGLVRALVEAVPGVGEALAIGDIAQAGVRAARSVPTRLSYASAANATRTAAADARVAAEGSTAAPGVFGLSGLSPDEPLVQGMRPRIIPPHVADELDFPVRVPDDPAVLRAIEAAGGTVDERGVTLNVIRNQGPEAAGGTATRGMTYHIAGPPGTPNPFAQGGDIGGSVRIEGQTRFRNPLFISQESGGKGYLDDALEQLGVMRTPDPAEVARWQASLDDQRARVAAGVAQGNHPNWVAEQQKLTQRFEREVQRAEAETPRPVAGRREIDTQVNRIQDSTAQGSSDRVQALQELVTRYGGDPSVIPELVRLRPTRAESGYAIVENIIAATARKRQHDGVIYLGKGIASAAEIDAHPRVAAANQALQRANVAENAAIAEADRLRDAGRVRGDPEYEAAWQRYERATERTREAMNETYAAERAARAELEPRTIEELADPREARNPTPGALAPRAEEAARAYEEAQAAYLNARIAGYSGTPTHTPEQIQALAAERNARYEAMRSLRDERVGHGYTLRPDIPRRAEVRASTIEPNPRYAEIERAYTEAVAREGRFYDQFLRDADGAESYEAWATRTGNHEALAARDAAQRAGEAFDRIDQAGGRFTTAQATAGALPPALRRGSDPFAIATRAIAEPLTGSIGGATIGAGLPADTEEQRRQNALTGAALGAGGFPLATRGARLLARAAGAAPSPGGGALATAGGIPPAPTRRAAAGQVPTGAPSLLTDPVGAYRAAKAENVAEMAAAGITPASKLGIARGVISTTAYSSTMGPATLSVQAGNAALEALRTGPKELVRVGAKAIATKNPQALKEAVMSGYGVAHGFERAGRSMLDLIRAKGQYVPSIERPSLSQQIADPIGKLALQVLETPARLWSGGADAIFGSFAQSAAEYKAAAKLATDAGHTGQKWDDWVNLYLREADRVRSTGSKQVGAGTKEVLEAGERAAERAAFREPLGDVGKRVRKFARLGLDDVAPEVGEFVTPYFNSAWNSLSRLAENTPAGLVMGRGDRSGFERAYDAFTGTAIIAGMGAYASSGNVTGSGPTDKNERQALMNEGWRPYHTKIGDTYYPNRMAGVFEPFLSAAGEWHDAIKYRKPEADQRKIGEDALARIGKLVRNQPYAAGIATILDAIEYGPASFVADVGTRYTPGAATIRAARTSQDTLERTTDRGKGVGFWDEVNQRYQQSIGNREDLPVAQDIMGRPQENLQQGLGVVLPKLPTAREDPVLGVFQDAGMLPPDPASAITLRPNVAIDLTPDERRRWDAARGQVLLEAGQEVLADPEWATIPKDRQQKILQRIFTVAAKAADGQVLDGIGDAEIDRRAEQAQARKAAS